MFKQKSKLIFFGLALLIIGSALDFFGVKAATGGIDPINRWAWNDALGWIDFGYALGNVTFGDTELGGYASSSAGFLALNCASTPNGNICGQSNFKVTNDGSGYLSGYAWNDSIGWISFSTSSPQSVYQTYINSNGDFYGFAWNDIVGWISFNCGNDFDPVAPGVEPQCATNPPGGPPGSVDYKVNTNWRVTPLIVGEITSNIFDSGAASTVNSIIYQGTRPVGTNVRFQIATSNCQNGKTNPPLCNDAGSWQYLGPDGTTASYYTPAGPGVSLAVTDRVNPVNKRYIRYKARLESNAAGSAGPTLDDVIINWSP